MTVFSFNGSQYLVSLCPRSSLQNEIEHGIICVLTQKRTCNSLHHCSYTWRRNGIANLSIELRNQISIFRNHKMLWKALKAATEDK